MFASPLRSFCPWYYNFPLRSQSLANNFLVFELNVRKASITSSRKITPLRFSIVHVTGASPSHLELSPGPFMTGKVSRETRIERDRLPRNPGPNYGPTVRAEETFRA